jgi:flap endonuclease GEN
MGLGKCFWDVVKPVARIQSLDSLRGKALAIDLSFWMIQLLSSVKRIPLRKPHLRLLFFRTLHLVAKVPGSSFVVTGIRSMHTFLDRFCGGRNPIDAYIP